MVSPEEMVLSLAFCMASLLNLSQCLMQEPAARAQALHELKDLQDWPTRLLISRY